MAEIKSIKIGTRVEVTGKGVVGTVAYVGSTLFSSGKQILEMWVKNIPILHVLHKILHFYSISCLTFKWTAVLFIMIK